MGSEKRPKEPTFVLGAPPAVTYLIAASPAKCDKQESTEPAERAGTSLTMSHFVLRSVGFAFLSRRLKPVLRRNRLLRRWPEGQLYPTATPPNLTADLGDGPLSASSGEAAC
jgi:hypothetical protein